MLTVSASKLRSNLFEYLDKVSAGETIVIKRNKQEVARLMPLVKADWRGEMTIRPQIKVSPDELIRPMDDVWEEYT